MTPCLDNCTIELCSVEEKVHIENSYIDNHTDSKNHTDYCSPLCICDCCNTVITYLNIFNLDYFSASSIIKIEKPGFNTHSLSTTSPPPKS